MKRVEKPERVRRFWWCTDKQQRQRQARRDNEHDDETDGQTDEQTETKTWKLETCILSIYRAN